VTDSYRWSVFTKPWAELPGDELGRLVAGLGFTGAEVPVRDTAFVTPATAVKVLPGFAEQLRAEGVEPISIASDLAESTFEAAAEARVPMIRIMAELRADGYAASVARVRVELEDVAAYAAQYSVRVGVQPHHGEFVASTLGVVDLLDGLPTEHFQVVWDAAHDALAGDAPQVTLDLAKDRLGIVNLKNATYVPVEPTGNVGGDWKPWFVPGTEGLSNWSAVFRALEQHRAENPQLIFQ
jgi:sugar phosphate isomerase/epimerase